MEQCTIMCTCHFITEKLTLFLFCFNWLWNNCAGTMFTFKYPHTTLYGSCIWKWKLHVSQRFENSVKSGQNLKAVSTTCLKCRSYKKTIKICTI